MNLSRMWAEATLTAKMLVRSWRFWILAVLAVLLSAAIPTYYSLLRFFLSGMSGTTAILLPSFVAYVAHLGITIVLGLAAVWYAFDAPYRHRKTRSEEILHATPLQTSELVVGDFLGILLPTSVVAAIATMITGGIQLAFRDGFPLIPHLAHLLFQTIPFLGALTAITICLAVVTRSRVVAGILGSASIVLTAGVLFGWFPMPWEYQQVVDLTGLWTIYFRSDMVGYMVFGSFLFQRVYIVLIAVTLLAIAVAFYPRLKGVQKTGLAPIVASVCLAVAIGMGIWWVLDWKQERWAAERAAVEQEALATEPATKVAHYDLDLDLTGGRDEVSGAVSMKLVNDTQDSRSKWVFTLNHGLEVESVEGAEFERGVTTLVLNTSPVPPGGETQVTVRYSGVLSDHGLFPGGRFELRDLETQARGNVSLLLGAFAYFVSDYAYLPAMAQFYPVPNVAHGYVYPERRAENWATAKISVTTPEGWTVATQGTPTQETGTRHEWVSETPVPEIAIYAGPYETVETTVADVPVRLAFHPGHRKAIEFFSDAKDVILERAEKQLKQAQDTTGLKYPYPMLNLVEVPMPARAYSDGLDSYAAFHAPGIVALRENGLFTANLTRRFKMMTGDDNVQVSVNGQSVTDSEEEGSGGAEGEASEDEGSEQGEEVQIAAGEELGEAGEAADEEEEGDSEDQKQIDLIAAKADLLENFFKYDFLGGSVTHAVIPSLWDFVLQPEGRLYPLLDRGLSGFVSDRATGQRRNFSVFALSELQQNIGNVFQGVFGGGMDWDDAVLMAGIDLDKTYDLMTSTPMEELDPTEDTKAYLDVVTIRGHAFFETLEQEIGASSFADALVLLREEHQYGTYKVEDLRRAVEQVRGEDMGWLFDSWLEGTDMPGFRLLEVNAYRIKSDHPQPKYQVVARLENPEPVDGYVTLELGLGRDDEPITRAVRVPGGQAVEWGAVVEEQPRRFRMSPVLAYNRNPSRRSLRDNDWTPKEAEEGHPFEGVREAEFESWPSGVIVDDSDPGFRVDGRVQSFARKLRGWVSGQGDDEKKFDDFNPWGGPGRDWARWKTEKAYGRYNPTVTVVRSGKGEAVAVWTAELPSAGEYEVMVYHPGPNLTRGFPKQMQERLKIGEEYRYSIGTGDGDETVDFDPARAETGWNSLGTFYFDSGETEVRLSDDVGSGMVWADAVRFVPQVDQRASVR